MLVLLVGSIVVSAILDLDSHGVAVLGKLPSALPDPAVPDVGWNDLVDLLPAAAGMLILSAEAAGVSRALASTEGYRVDVNRDLVALGGSNLLAGFSSGFVQSGGASQTMAGERAGGRTQLSSLVAAGIVLLTGAFLTSLFKQLPEATLAAIVVVAISGFFRVRELERFGRIRRSAFVLSLIALVGVLVLGVLPGLLVAVVLSLILLIKRLSRPPVVVLARDPETGAWGRAERHPGWAQEPSRLVIRSEGAAVLCQLDRGEGARPRAGPESQRPAGGRARPLGEPRARRRDGGHARRARGQPRRHPSRTEPRRCPHRGRQDVTARRPRRPRTNRVDARRRDGAGSQRAA
jgi:SulP family sulfate permease